MYDNPSYDAVGNQKYSDGEPLSRDSGGEFRRDGYGQKVYESSSNSSSQDSSNS